MILSDFLIYTDKGLYCRYADFYLDPQMPVRTAIISHAHGDHACPGNQYVSCTPATAAIMELRLKKNAARHFDLHLYNEPFQIGEVSVILIPAGHILGSAQILMEYKGVKYLYTGDIKLQSDQSCEAAEFAHADVLITETTFADPEVAHPDAGMEISKLNRSADNILLGAYALGKAQRLISLINQYCPDRHVLLHHKILPLARLYEQHGIKLGKYEPYNRKLMKNQSGGFVYIVPPLTFDCYFRAKGVLRAFASGWAKLQRQNDLELYISDHVDWKDLLSLIEQVRPREIWTLHGNGTLLQEHLKDSIPVTVLHSS